MSMPRLYLMSPWLYSVPIMCKPTSLYCHFIEYSPSLAYTYTYIYINKITILSMYIYVSLSEKCICIYLSIPPIIVQALITASCQRDREHINRWSKDPQ